MSVPRIKTLLIAALLTINAFFLTLIIIHYYTDTRDERQAIENTCAILRLNNIGISPGDIKASGRLITMRTVRVIDSEAAIAGVFLGQADMTYQGVIYRYENKERGTAEFYSAGGFEIKLHDGVITDGDDTLKTVQRLLRDMKLAATPPAMTVNDENKTVSIINSYKGASIYNCTIDFVFNEGCLRTVGGRYVTDIAPADDGIVIPNVSTALLGFLAAVKRGDIDCTLITNVEAGYFYSAAGPSGEGLLTPVWLITTSDGRFRVDGATGEIRQI